MLGGRQKLLGGGTDVGSAALGRAAGASERGARQPGHQDRSPAGKQPWKSPDTPPRAPAGAASAVSEPGGVRAASSTPRSRTGPSQPAHGAPERREGPAPSSCPGALRGAAGVTRGTQGCGMPGPAAAGP